MTAEAPAAMALVTSPEYLIPPSAMIGMPFGPATLKTSEMAVIWGMPAPVMIRVVQMEPGPTPTLTASTPRSMSSSAARAVPMLPAMSSCSANSFLSVRTVSRTLCEWPWALSTTRTSHLAATRALARSRKSEPTPMAAPTLSRPRLSLAASGYWIHLRMSL